LSQWLRFYGPIEPAYACAVFGLPRERLDVLLEDLVEEEQVVLDRMSAGSETILLCDRENLEALLRISRARARPEVRTLPVEELPAFIARRQGLIPASDGLEKMKDAWERLFGIALPASAWEEEVFPARLRGYRTQWLDTLLAGAPLFWFGCGKGRISFCFSSDTELFLGDSPDAELLGAVFPAAPGRYSFWDLADSSGLHSVDLAGKLWDLAWKGHASNDSFAAVRRGILSGFRAEDAGAGSGHGAAVGPGGPAAAARSRRTFDRWKASRPAAGFWFRLPRDEATRDALDEEEIVRDRVRQVLQRYGVIFRELLENELPPLRWGRLFRSLRLMEFSGEVVTGRFFDGIRGLQFAHPSVLDELAAESRGDEVWWLNAADPASLCGADIEALKGVLPSRLPTTHVVFHGHSVVLVSRRRGVDLEVRIPPDAPRLQDYLGFITVLTGREWRPMSAVRVESINGEPAVGSPYRPALTAFGFVDDYRRLVYRARI
jgi:ATP-dependent Lhr-like helicase